MFAVAKALEQQLFFLFFSLVYPKGTGLGRGLGTPNPSPEQVAAGLQSSEGTLNTFYSARGDD